MEGLKMTGMLNILDFCPEEMMHKKLLKVWEEINITDYYGKHSTWQTIT